MTETILIAAIGKNRELGKGPDLIWRLPSDLKRFKELTSGHPIIMGRKTFESIGRPLPNRTNIILTRTPLPSPLWVTSDVTHVGVKVVDSFEAALRAAQESEGGEKTFVIGGGEMYKTALPVADTLDLTLIYAEEPRATVFFPEFETEFEKVSESELKEENGVRFTWAQFKKRRHPSSFVPTP